MHTLVAQTLGYLRLRIPYKIVIKPYLKGGNSAEYYEMRRKGKLTQHLIRVNMRNLYEDNARSFESLLVHEFIHAWQAENEILEADHGPEFVRIAQELEYHWNIPGIYIPGTDI